MNAMESPAAASAAADHPTDGPSARTRDGRRLLARLVTPALLSALRRWQVGRLSLQLPDGRTLRVGPPDAQPQVTLRVRDERFFGAFALRGDLGAGESYMDGDWDADDLPTFIELALRNQQAAGRDTWLTRILTLPDAVRHALRLNSRRGTRRNIRHHYDLSNDFFAFFLDESMTYSSAVFESPADSLLDAQRRKFARLADRLALGPGDHVLEIGCGWGAFAVFAARTYGCRVTGLTISREQFTLARARVRQAGLDQRVDIHLCDYRDVAGSFSKIVSIEMLEAVGRRYWPTFFETCDRVLAPGGLVGLQVITIPDHRFDEYARRCDWIQKYIFPGGLLPSLGQVCQAMRDRTALTVRHLDDIGLHYAETLARWRSRFFGRLADVHALGFDDRFVRMWDFYLASCEAAFRMRALGTLQLVLGRAGL